jgi:dihydrofolate reductase/thymidylate synthase
MTNHEETQYLDLIKKILETCETRETRNSITKSIFSEKLEFDISNSIPFITTKKLAWKTVIKELLWFLSGSTDNKKLTEQNVNIWNGNSTREYMDSIGFTSREVNDLGPVYGHQWRHFNADYADHKTDYTNKGIDQIEQVIYMLKNDPMSRRIILSAWNPCQISQMNLPPCHMMAQFYVTKDQKLSCQMYQRSADMFLGVPFNIASYALFTHMLAQVCDLGVGELTIVLGDAHIYENHVAQVKQQLKRKTLPLPKLKLNKDIKNITDFTMEDIELVGYTCHEAIKAPMAV